MARTQSELDKAAAQIKADYKVEATGYAADLSVGANVKAVAAAAGEAPAQRERGAAHDRPAGVAACGAGHHADTQDYETAVTDRRISVDVFQIRLHHGSKCSI